MRSTFPHIKAFIKTIRKTSPKAVALLALIAAVATLTLVGTSPVTAKPSPALQNAPIVVTTLVDENDGVGVGTGTSLREAILAANAAAGDDEIVFTVTGTINLASELPALSSNVKIIGPGASALTVRREAVGRSLPFVRIFLIASGSTVTISGLTVSNGFHSVGGGIYNLGTLNVFDSTFTDNSSAITGGAIENEGELNVTNSTFYGNSTVFGGGGIRNSPIGATLNVINSTFYGNSAGGGAIQNQGNSSTANVTNSTFYGNTGGAISNSGGLLNVTNSTIAGNSARFFGGGIFTSNFTGALTNVLNTIIALNTAPSGPDVFGRFNSLGHNLIGKSDGSVGFTHGVNGDKVGTSASPLDPGLELDSSGGPVLKNNGGPTDTIALLCNSPAIDMGDNSVLGPPFSLTTDQRGLPRSVDGNGDSVPIVDIGAFELQQVALTLTCPANITAVASQGSCTSGGQQACQVVTFPAPAVEGNCPGATVTCSPASGSCLPPGTTTITCTATDVSGATASCSFTVTVFDVCLQDDSDPGAVLQFSSSTGDYRFCCDGVTYTGKGKVSQRGCVITLEHNAADRRVFAQVDKGVFRGTASLQSPPGSVRCAVIDRNTRNSSCTCQ